MENKQSLLAAAAGFLAASACGVLRRRLRRRRRARVLRRSGRQADGSGEIDCVDGYLGLIGNTPLVRLASLSEATGCEIYAKAEFLNPGGSCKDRIAKRMLAEAADSGALADDGVVVEGTSGSTGISLALVARAMGLDCHIFMPDDQAVEKSELLTALGADVKRVPTVAIVNRNHYCKQAEAHAAALGAGKALYTDQFENLANFRAHFTTTGPEVWRQTAGRVDAFVMAAGTGGMIAGVSRYLKARKADVRIILSDPQGSALYYAVNSGVAYAPEQAERAVRRYRHDTIVEGVGLGRLTSNFKLAAIDAAYRVSDREAVAMAHFLLRNEGLFVGSSSALNCVAAVRAAREMKKGSVIVTVLCDVGQRHMSKLYNPDFLASRGLTPDEHAVGLSFISDEPPLPLPVS